SGAHDFQLDWARVFSAHNRYWNGTQAAGRNVQSIIGQVEIEPRCVRRHDQAIGLGRSIPGEKVFDNDREIAVTRGREIDRLANLWIAGGKLRSLRILDDHVHFRW